MRNYKRLLIAVTALLLVIFIGILIWLWDNNRQDTDPLPIMVNAEMQTSKNENQ